MLILKINLTKGFNNTAKLQGEIDAKRSFHFALEAEKMHVELFRKALDAVKEGTILDGAPGKCPVCGLKQELYKKFNMIKQSGLNPTDAFFAAAAGYFLPFILKQPLFCCMHYLLTNYPLL